MPVDRGRAIFSSLMIDIHCHLLPGVDDGPGDLAGSLSMAQALVELGFRHVCTTPHLPWGGLGADSGELERVRQELASELRERRIELSLAPGAEHFSQSVLELLATDRLVSYPRGDTFLMEFPFSGLPPRYQELLFLCRVKGKVPVIAHLERYPEVQGDLSLAEFFKQQGCYLLVNLGSLVGSWSRPAQQAARELLRRGLVDAATSDMHSVGESHTLAEGLSALRNQVGLEGVQKLLLTGPREIVGL